MYEIEINDVLNEWSLEEYIIRKDKNDAYGKLIYKE